MNDIGPEAKSLFEAARKADGLPAPKRARIRRAVLLQAAALGAASGVAGGAVAMSVAAKVTLVTVTAAVLGGGSASVWAWKKHKASVRPTRAVPTQPHTMAAVNPAVIRQAPVPEPVPPVFEAPAEPQRRAPARTEVRRVAPAPSPATEPTPAPAIVKPSNPVPESLDSELALLRQAQEDLRLGLPAQALRRLADFDGRFPRARLDQERQAIEAIAGCQVSPGPAARARAQRFLQQAPRSPLAARVRSACVQSEDDKSFNETSPRREPSL